MKLPIPTVKLNITRRWHRARPGSVLILVVALLVLLALIGTAYLSSTQTERYTSNQNSINTEADLLLQGMINTLNSSIAGALFSNSAYRPPSQEMTLPTGGTPTGYNHYTSSTTDKYLADRVPQLVTIGVTPTVAWNALSLPLFTDTSSNYTFDSPIGSSITTCAATNKGQLIFLPTYIPGTSSPALKLFIPAGKKFTNSDGTTIAGPSYLSANPILAASAAGDGIADAGFVKLPIGPVNGITYYVATKVVDGNSAINASSAWTQGADSAYNANPSVNYGFFRTNIGLQELLFSSTGSPEIGPFNAYRCSGVVPTAAVTPDAGAPNNFQWYSYGDVVENQLTRRPGNTGFVSAALHFNWLGQTETANLAYKSSMYNNNTGPSELETLLSSELRSAAMPTSPWSATQVTQWFNANFASLYAYNGTNPSSPLRTILTGNNAVSNAIPSRLGNTSAGTIPAWQANITYNFGDWVTDLGTNGLPRSYVCIQQQNSANKSSALNKPGTGTNPGAVGIWAGEQGAVVANSPPPGMPWTQVPVKASVNTATFDQLWIAFAQLMTDSVSGDNGAAGGPAQWQPPMQPAAVAAGLEQQLPQFRSVVRSITGAVASRLTSSQMLKLRAAIAAVNTLDLRDTDDDVSSQHIVLTDVNGNPQYDVEVYGTEKQPYISELVLQVDGTAGDTYAAIELVNPYLTPITLTNWQIGSLNRSSIPMNISDPGVVIPTVTIPAATSAGVPGILVLQDGTAPADVATTINNNQTANPTGVTVKSVAGLANAAVTASQPNEIFVMRPRLANGALSTGTGRDIYNETKTSDLVPIDQMDLTDLKVPTIAGSPPVRFLYRRGSDGTIGKLWNMIFPGVYDATAANPSGRYFTDSTKGVTAIQTDTFATAPCNLGAADGGASAGAASTYTTLGMELNNAHMAGPNPTNAATIVFPFGQFARNGDLLQIPFIGGYRIRPWSAANAQSDTVTELNSVTIDSALVNDTTLPAALAASVAPAANSPFIEQLGRFCPVGDPVGKTYDFNNDPTAGPANWHYHWAKRLFDYLTIQSPQDDYFPNVDPAAASPAGVVAPSIAAKYPGGVAPAPVANYTSTIANDVTGGSSEDTVGNEGLININTAPVAVLAQLPFTATSITPSASMNATIAQWIVNYRNTNGPFKSIMDLYSVTPIPAVVGSGFRAENDAILAGAAPPGPPQGIFSPAGIATGAAVPTGTVRYDFQERFLLLNNISNLITTRSDTFTCYVLLQGWRNVGTSNPTLAVQRRAAFLVDRNSVTPSNNIPTNFKVPSD